jgi:DNA-binding beta-propeller fold protein YncE
MFSHRARGNPYPAVLLILLPCVAASPTIADALISATQPAPTTNDAPAAAHLSFVRVFSSADDVRRTHPILDRTLDIIAGPADPVTHVDALQSPSAVATDSNHRVFVADTAAHTVHVFDFDRSKYDHLDPHGDRLHNPISLSVDARDNLYVVDQSSRTVLVYDATGKFRRPLGKLRGGESYFDSPAAIAIDQRTGRIYVSDRLRHMIFVMDARGKLVRRLGNRGGGDRPGEFRFPGQVVVAGNELFVLDSGNARIQVLDTAGHFLRAISLGDTDPRSGLAVDHGGNVYVSDPYLTQIQVFGHDGQMLYRLDLGKFPGGIKGTNFSNPSALWIDAGDCLYVVDSQTNRVGVFQIKRDEEKAPQ